MVDLIIILILVATVGGALCYIAKKKRAGSKCIGCPYADCCQSRCNDA